MTIIRLGAGAQADTARLIVAYGAGGTSKSRSAAACCRARPDVYGERAALVCADPGSEGLGPILEADRGRMEKVGFDAKSDVYTQIMDILQFDWKAEGIKTCIWDTMTTVGQIMLAQLANSGKFSERNIELSTVKGGEAKQPMQGDFLAAETLLFRFLYKLRDSGMNHILLFHELDVRPEQGTPGDPYGGPAFVGKAMTRKIGGWATQTLRFSTRPKKRATLTAPIEQEYVVHTEDRGIWKAKFRLPQPTNPCPEIVLNPDPINLWQTLEGYLNPVEAKREGT